MTNDLRDRIKYSLAAPAAYASMVLRGRRHRPGKPKIDYTEKIVVVACLDCKLCAVASARTTNREGVALAWE